MIGGIVAIVTNTLLSDKVILCLQCHAGEGGGSGMMGDRMVMERCHLLLASISC